MRGALIQIDLRSQGPILVYVINRVSGCLPIKIFKVEARATALICRQVLKFSHYCGPFVSVVVLVSEEQASEVFGL